MIFNEKTAVLKNGTAVTLKSPEISDAALLLEYLNGMTAESPYILRTPEDCTDTVEGEAKFIEECLKSPYKLMISAYYGGKIIGNCNINFNKRKKIAHKCEFGIGIRREFRGLGLGTVLVNTICDEAKARGCKLVTLIYIDGNERGRRLYEKCGFSEFGRLPGGTLMPDGDYADDVYMAKYL